MKTKFSLKLSSLAAAALLPLTFNALQLTAVATPTTITYQGRVIDNGAPFTGTGGFKFALVTSMNVATQATATAQLTGTFVTSCTVVNPGNGYVTPPAVTLIGGGGSNATATAMISGGAVTNITINNSGAGYATAPSVLIAPPPPLLAFVSYWSNDGTSFNGSEPVSAVSVGVTNGLFTVVLGDPTAGMVTMDSSLFASQPNLQLRIWFNDGLNGSAVLSPVQNLTPTPYAIEALSAPASALTSIGNSNGFGNFFVGSSGNATTTGFYNTADGFNSMTSDKNGSYNTALGSYSLFLNTNGVNNTAIGYQALYNNTSGSQNTAEGTYALYGNTTGNNNTAVGYNALGPLNTGSWNIAIGRDAGTAINTGTNNIDIGNAGFGDESNVIRIGSTQTKAVMLGIYPTTINSSAGLVCVNPSGLLGTGSASGTFLNSSLQLEGDLSLSGGAAYHNLSMSGGNAVGYLYGSFPALGDGVHLGYNYYYDAGGGGHISNAGGGTSRISAEYGEIILAVGGVNAAPTTVKVDVTTSSVTVNGTFNNNSDRNAKKNFAPVSPSQILDKVTQLPLSEWSYKDDAATRHVGPMAQDFYSIFNVGTDEKHIAPIDEGGVALAAIQGLNQKVEEKDKKILEQESMIQRQSAEISEMKARLEKLEQHLLNHDSN
jgi:hypothetical protein